MHNIININNASAETTYFLSKKPEYTVAFRMTLSVWPLLY